MIEVYEIGLKSFFPDMNLYQKFFVMSLDIIYQDGS